MNTKVSVIIPVFNQEKYLRQALESACTQTYRNVEVIVVNDGSTDGTVTIIDEAVKKYRNIIWIHQDNQGLARARNKGIERSSGNFLAFLDSDDYWKAERLGILVSFMNNHPDIGLVHNLTQTVDANSRNLATVFKGREGYLYTNLATFDGLNIPPPSTVLIRREVIDRVGVFEVGLGGVEDQDFYIRVARHFKVGRVNEVLGYYRMHSGNMHKNNIATEMGFLKLMNKIKLYHDLPLADIKRGVCKGYFLLSVIRWKSGRGRWKTLYYLLMSFMMNPKFFASLCFTKRQLSY